MRFELSDSIILSLVVAYLCITPALADPATHKGNAGSRRAQTANHKAGSHQADPFVDPETRFLRVKWRGVCKDSRLTDLYSLAEVAERHGHPEQAFDYLNKAVELSPTEPSSYTIRGNLYSRQNKLRQAIQDYTQAIQLRADPFSDYYNRAAAYRKTGLFQLALADYKRCLEFRPTDDLSILAMGNCYLEMDDREHALKSFTQGIETCKKFSPQVLGQCYYSRAGVRKSLNDPSGAIEDYKSALTAGVDPETTAKIDRRLSELGAR